MDLFILRHGLAVERGTPGYERDFDRPLTPEGEKKIRGIAKAMGKMELNFERILSSPYVRARQTAEIVEREFAAGKRSAKPVPGVSGVTLSESLGAEAHPRDIVQELNRAKQLPGAVLLVGHEPYLSTLISLLITGKEEGCLTLKKGGLAKLSVDPLREGRCATLDWLLTPKQLLRIA